jgi:hypothetical protein
MPFEYVRWGPRYWLVGPNAFLRPEMRLNYPWLNTDRRKIISCFSSHPKVTRCWNFCILEVKKKGPPQGGQKQRIRAKRRIPTVRGGYLCSVDSVRLDSCPPFWHLISQCYEHSYSTTHSRDDDIITRQPNKFIVHHPCVVLNCVTWCYDPEDDGSCQQQT